MKIVTKMSFQVLDDFTILLMNMIFAELVMVLFGVPVNFIASIQHGWKMGKTVCDVFGFMLTLEGESKTLKSTSEKQFESQLKYLTSTQNSLAVKC